jgi:hypothetical protein
MKYLQFGWAVAGCTVVAICLTVIGRTPSVPPTAPEAQISAAPPSAGAASAIPDATAHHELSRLPTKQDGIDAQQTEQAKLEQASPEKAEATFDSPTAAAPDTLSAATNGVEGGADLQSTSTVPAAPDEPSHDSLPLLLDEKAATEAVNTDQAKLNEESLQITEQASHDPAMREALSQHECLPSADEKAVADIARAEAAILEQDWPEGAELITNSAIAEAARDLDSAVPLAAADEPVVPVVPSASALSAVPGESSQDRSSQSPEENNAIEAPKPEQAGLGENSQESAEPGHEFRTASAMDDFDYAGPPGAVDNVDVGVVLPSAPALSAISGQYKPLLPEKRPVANVSATEQAKLEENAASALDSRSDSIPSKHSFLAYYVYDEHPPPRRPADIVLDSLRNVPLGSPLEEIKRAADAFGLNYNFMKTVAKIESDFDPKQRTGSYIGLFQLNHYEFNKYGSGDITNPRDNAIAAAYKFITEGTMFEWDTHKDPTFSDLYLIHQQGWQGAAEHVAHPGRIAWLSMCATDEGKEKGEKWCKRAVWQNTLPNIKQLWKSVENMTSGAFVYMWRQRVERLYARYTGMLAGKSNDEDTSNPPSYLKPPPAASAAPFAAPSADGRKKFARQIAAGKARSVRAAQERSAEGRKKPGHQIAALQTGSPQTAKERRADGRKRFARQIASNQVPPAAAEHPAEGRKKLARQIAVSPAKSPQAVPAHAVTGRHHRPRGTTALLTIPNRTS